MGDPNPKPKNFRDWLVLIAMWVIGAICLVLLYMVEAFNFILSLFK